MTTSLEIARELAAANPDRRFATESKGSVVGVWNDAAGRFVAVASQTITNQWAFIPDGLPLANGRPVVADGDWIELGSDSINEPLTREGRNELLAEVNK